MSADAALSRYLREQEAGDAYVDWVEANYPELDPDSAEALNLFSQWEAAQEDAYWEAYAEAQLARYDDDPNPYHGDYGEDW